MCVRERERMCVYTGGGAGDDDAEALAMKQKIASVFAVVHLSVSTASGRMLLELKRHNYVTPTNYLELVRGYRELLAEKRRELGDAKYKLQNGLTKLDESRVQVCVCVTIHRQCVCVCDYT